MPGLRTHLESQRVRRVGKAEQGRQSPPMPSSLYLPCPGRYFTSDGAGLPVAGGTSLQE